MKDEMLQVIYRNKNDYKRLLYTIICQQIRQPGKNGYVPWNVKPVRAKLLWKRKSE